MRGLVTTLGAAAAVGITALGLATPASADPSQGHLPTGSLITVHGTLALDGGNAADRRADRFHECMARAQASGMPLTGATIEGCVVVMNMADN
ncbi:MAG: hypothetical protein U0R18_12150 [Mycobacterium sp.]